MVSTYQYNSYVSIAFQANFNLQIVQVSMEYIFRSILASNAPGPNLLIIQYASSIKQWDNECINVMINIGAITVKNREFQYTALGEFT